MPKKKATKKTKDNPYKEFDPKGTFWHRPNDPDKEPEETTPVEDKEDGGKDPSN